MKQEQNNWQSVAIKLICCNQANGAYQPNGVHQVDRPPSSRGKKDILVFIDYQYAKAYNLSHMDPSCIEGYWSSSTSVNIMCQNWSTLSKGSSLNQKNHKNWWNFCNCEKQEVLHLDLSQMAKLGGLTWASVWWSKALVGNTKQSHRDWDGKLAVALLVYTQHRHAFNHWFFTFLATSW